MNYCFAVRKISRLLLQLRAQANKNKLVMDSPHIPNIVNEHFALVGSKLASKIPSFQQH